MEGSDCRLSVTLVVLDGEPVNAGDANQEQQDSNRSQAEVLGAEESPHGWALQMRGRGWANCAVLGFASVMEPPKLTDLPEGLLNAVRTVAARLSDAGHRSWLVGGAVRDLAMGRVPGDADMATDATPDEVEECFPSTVPLGKRFGTVLVNAGGQGVEVTTLRAEDGYSDGRRPDQVVFGTSVLEDASRRDFTVNAMYLDAISGEFLDPVRGMDSLLAGQLSAVGDAAARFQEDGLRILRLARFSASLRLAPCADTQSGARSSR